MLLANFAPATRDALIERGHNVKVCEIRGADSQNPNRKCLATPSPPNEIDIFVVRDTRPVARTETPGRMGDIFAGGFVDEMRSRVGSVGNTKTFCNQIMANGGTCVFFVGNPDGFLLRYADVGIARKTDTRLFPRRTAYRWPETEAYRPLVAFIERHYETPEVYLGLGLERGMHRIHHLLEDSIGTPYVIAGPPFPSTAPKGFVICLPDYGDAPDVLHDLLATVLPDLSPHLFPFQEDQGWLREPEFRHPEAVVLEGRRITMENEMRRAVGELEREIQALEEPESHLRRLLTTGGDALVKAVEASLNGLFALTGATDAKLRHERGGLRLDWKDRFVLIQVAGSERELRGDVVNQLDDRRYQFLKSLGAPVETVHSLVVANFDFRKRADPRKRGPMFGDEIAAVHERLLQAHHGAMSGWDLFRVIRAQQRRDIALMPDDVLRVLTAVGLFDFDTFIAAQRGA
ncbi:MAG: hypothetical protein HY294_11400 [Candidatus Rokubacteria bacterium]|nr:hypothetical protein [Candidatus Rokubacteria bacterium]MBI3826593.1 hypothetical protein [Candidatus Rokubacteria bacterium]